MDQGGSLWTRHGLWGTRAVPGGVPRCRCLRPARSGQTAATVIGPRTAQVSPAQESAAPSPVCGREGTCHRGGVPGALPHPDRTVLCHRRPVRPRAPHPARRAVTRNGRGCHRRMVTTRRPHGTRTVPGSVHMSPTSCSALSCCPRRDGQTCRGGRWVRSWCSRRLPCPVLRAYLFTVHPRCWGHRDTRPAPQDIPAAALPPRDLPVPLPRDTRGTQGQVQVRGAGFGTPSLVQAIKRLRGG